MDYPAEFDVDVVLRDGEVIRIRPIRPEDRELEARFIGRTSDESLYQRFFRAKRGLTDKELDYFTQVDYRDRMAFIALHDGEMVAVGRYDVVPTPDATDDQFAEVAFLVQDEFQGRGIGTLLLQQLTRYARLQGIQSFRAFVLAENRRMLDMFRSSGYTVHRRDLSGTVYELELPTEYSQAAREAAAQHEKWAISTSLGPLFRPSSVAVIGASRDPDAIGGRLFRNLIAADFNGPVYPVNASADVVAAVKAYHSILEVPGPVDLAVIVVPARYVSAVVEECNRADVKAVVVISAGFGEIGEEGQRLEHELVQAVRSGGMRMVGPNCMGLLNTADDVRLDAQFGPIFPPAGNVAMSSQSGALGLAILDYARQLDVGISTFVSVGNKADVSGNDLLLYWEDDPATDVILLYLESFGNPRRFSRLARRVGRSKPIVAVKSGRSTAGARAAASHTGSLASVDVAVDALFRQSGVIRTDTLSELFDVTTLLANQPVPAGRRVAVVTNAGGPGILAADALAAEGLELPELSPSLQEALAGRLPAEASTTNPVDMIASASTADYEFCLAKILESDEVDSVIAVYIPVTTSPSDDVAAAIANRAQGTDKTVLSVFMESGGGSQPATLGNVVPRYPFPEPAARALGAAVRYGAWRQRPEGELVVFDDMEPAEARSIVEAALARLGEDGGWLEADETGRLLAAAGIPMPASEIVTNAQEARQAADRIGGPVAVKVIADSVLHKSDVGGVALDVAGAPNAVARAYESVTAVADDSRGALIQEMVPGGHEVIIGMAEDPTFGPLIAFGLGGIYVELMQDVAFRISPVTDLDVTEMIADVKAARLLEGFRGSPPSDLAALEAVIHRVSALVEQLPEIAEMDLNPVKVLAAGEGVRVVDARIRVSSVSELWLPSRKDVPGQLRR